MYGHCARLASTPSSAHVTTVRSGSRAPSFFLASPVNVGFSLGMTTPSRRLTRVGAALGGDLGADVPLQLVHDAQEIPQVGLRQARQRGAEDLHGLDLDLPRQPL